MAASGCIPRTRRRCTRWSSATARAIQGSRSIRDISRQFDVGRLDYGGPSIDFLVHIFRRLLDRAAKYVRGQFAQQILHLGLTERFVDVGIDLVDDVLRRVG